MVGLMPMHRIPVVVRALVLVPLLALGVDHARAAIACGPGAESCLEAAGHGWIGVTGVLLLVAYATAVAVAVGRLAAGRAPGMLRLWLLATAGIAAVCGGQALIAAALGDGAALGGGWIELGAYCAAAGAALALALRAAPAADPAAHGLGLIARDAARMLTPAEAGRIRICGSDTCSARFYDRSPAGRRRWCSMRGCGNEAKARRHRARRKAAA
jgi:hypothetical protein